MIARPYGIDRLLKSEPRFEDICACMRMLVPTSDEHVIDPAAMRRLPDDLLNPDFCVWILVGPRPARSLTGNRPCVVIVNAPSVQRLTPG